MVGNELCIDSCWYPPTMEWMWVAWGVTKYAPAWDGPHCFEVIENTIDFSGFLKYVDPLGSGGSPDTLPMRGVTIQMLDQDRGTSIDTLATTSTDDSGYFDFGAVNNWDDAGVAGQELFFRIFAENVAAKAVESYGGVTYYVQTATENNITSGVYDTTIVATSVQSGYFLCIDEALDGQQKWYELRPDDSLSVLLELVIAADSGYSRFDADSNCVYVNDSAITAKKAPDTFDRDVIQALFGKRIACEFSFCDSGSTAVCPVDSVVDPAYAAKEGFSRWWASVVSESPNLVNTWNNYSDSFWVNVENGEFGTAGSTDSSRLGTANALGDANEVAVAGILWDICDTIPDDYSGRDDWGIDTIPHTPDSVYDSLSISIDTVLLVFLDRGEVNGHNPKTMNEFWDAWFSSTSPGQSSRMGDVWYEHGDSAVCCETPGDINGNGTGPDIADLVYLVNYMFKSGTDLPCEVVGDVNGNEVGPDIQDLVYFVNYMFKNGPDLADCP